MGVVLPFPIVSANMEKEKPSLTYKLDLDMGRIIGKVDGIEAVEQAIRKALITPRFKCIAYDNQYGSEIEQSVIIGNATEEYIRADLPRLISDALSQDTRIRKVKDVNFDFKDNRLYISFTVETIYGTTTISEVI